MDASELRLLVESGDVDAAADWLARHPSPEDAVLEEDAVGWNLIDVAAYARQPEMVRMLLRHAEPTRTKEAREEDQFQTAFVAAYRPGLDDYRVEYILLGYIEEEMTEAQLKTNPFLKALRDRNKELFDSLRFACGLENMKVFVSHLAIGNLGSSSADLAVSAAGGNQYEAWDDMEFDAAEDILDTWISSLHESHADKDNVIVRFYFDTMLETYKRLLSEDRRRQRLQHLLGAAIRLSQRHVVRRLLRDRDTRHLKLLDANEGGNEPLRFADDEVIIRAIVESPGYSPTANFVCRTGKSLLHYLCDCKPHPGLYGKVNDLFLKSAPVAGSAVVRQQQKRPPVFEPGEGKDLVLTADQSHNFDLVWILLREGPIDDVDLNTIDFFRAVRDGHDRDGEEEISGDTFMHVFAKIGFYRGIAYAQKHFERDYEEYLTDICADLTDLYLRPNLEGNLPSMEAARGNHGRALELLIFPIYQDTLMRFATTQDDLEHLLTHHRNREGHTLLYLVTMHQAHLYHVHSVLVNLETRCHGGDILEVSACLRESLGSSKEAVEVLDIIRKNDNPGIYRRLRWGQMFATVLLLPLIIYFVDFYTDAQLILDYYEEMNSPQFDSIRENCTSTELRCIPFESSPQFQFGLSVFAVVSPWLFFAIEVSRYLSTSRRIILKEIRDAEMRGKSVALAKYWYYQFLTHTGFFGKALARFLAWLFWPFREYALTWWYLFRCAKSQTDSKFVYDKKYKAHQAFSTRAHLIEVCCESSLMALLQFYLFLPTLISYSRNLEAVFDVTVNDIFYSRASKQVLSITFSVLSLSFKFTRNYRKRKHGALGPVATSVHFLSNFCLVVARMVAFAVFTFTVGPAAGFSVVAAHVAFMACLTCASKVKVITQPAMEGSENLGRTRLIYIFFDMILGGLADIFVYNEVDVLADQHTDEWLQRSAAAGGARRRLVYVVDVSRRRRRTSCCCSRRSRCPADCYLQPVRVGRSTCVKQSVYDMMFVAETVILVMVGYEAEVREVDPVYNEAFRGLATIIGTLVVAGYALKAAYYLLLHPYAALIGRDFAERARLAVPWNKCPECEYNNSKGIVAEEKAGDDAKDEDDCHINLEAVLQASALGDQTDEKLDVPSLNGALALDHFSAEDDDFVP